ncbi:7776_t:CDS:2 [Cetraspora pellucida]|uniref:7776_t:CDS:1 n=1 Tax=Cetraspora pellucida TaxID=1433469 RepID=A0A9N8WTK5_9GLOM|nr:7776_t:CDS:2 [Cetraspora pellucida]
MSCRNVLVEYEDNKIEMVLFVPINPDKRDLKTQAVFEKDSFYSVGSKIVPSYYREKKRLKMTVSISTFVSILNKVERSNKCPLKVSLVGIPQELPQVISSDENAIFNVSISDYIGQSYDFIVKMEIIDDDFYVYAKEINSIDTHFLFKRNVFSNNESFNVSEIANTTRLKLLSMHWNIIENLKRTSDIESTFSDNHVDKFRSSSFTPNDLVSLKRTRTECSDDSTVNSDVLDNNEFQSDEVVDVNQVVSSNEVSNRGNVKKVVHIVIKR